jgi:hypothetical protein
VPEVPENESKKLHKITPMALRWSRMPVSRLQIFAVWVFVAILAAITGHAISLHVFEIASAACIAFFLWSFVQGPYLLYTKNWRPLRADYRVSENPIRPEFPKPRVDALLSLGFQPAGELVQDPAGRNVLAHFAMFIHPANKDSAQLGRIMSGLQIIHIVVFKARFDDGFAFETSNSHVAPIFEPDPRFHVFRFADVRSTHDLYRLHRKIKEQFFASQHSVLADERGELAEFMARAEVIHQKHAQGGDYKLSPAGDRSRLHMEGSDSSRLAVRLADRVFSTNACTQRRHETGEGTWPSHQSKVRTIGRIAAKSQYDCRSRRTMKSSPTVTPRSATGPPASPPHPCKCSEL